MARNKRPEAAGGAASIFAYAALVFTTLGRRGVAALLALVVLIGLGVVAWRQWGPEITRAPQYVLDETKIDVTPQPAWIHTNVKRDAIRSGNLAGLSILDPKLTEKVEHAFAVQTWVAGVRRVVKQHPARVVVEIEYRRPVAMVEIRPQETVEGLLPVDAYGVLLPPEDFSENQVRSYLRVAVGATQPQGPVGTAWGDERVAAAARVALALDEVWQKLQLYRIEISGPPGGAPTFDLTTKEGARVIWGHAPGDEASGEATAAEKIATLAAWHAEHGPLTSERSDVNVRDGRPPAKQASQRRPK